MRRLLIPLFAVLACSKPADPAHAERPTEAAAATKPPAQPPAPKPEEVILNRKTLTEAIAFARPYMEDSADGEPTKGTVLLASWSAGSLRWSDLDAIGETHFAQVKKDSDAHRGQRICTRGTVIQIEAFHRDSQTLFAGLMMDNYRNLTSFVAVHSTGDLVERSWARFCGIVVGKYDYPNSAGGVGHAVQLVGMFDLPENRR